MFMKNLLPILLFWFCLLFLSCTKEKAASPAAASIQTSSPVSFTSNNIAIQNFKAQETNNQITVGFSTTFQKEIKSLEILKGESRSNLCSIYKTNGSGTSTAVIQYTTNDSQTAPVLYYIVKYTLQNGDWGYTSVFTLETDK